MSLTSWKKEFYPIKAGSKLATATELTAVDHCLTKWEGLREKNLVKHGLPKKDTVYVGELIGDLEEAGMEVDNTTCALCHRHKIAGSESESPPSFHMRCSDCVLFDLRYGFECYRAITLGSGVIPEERSPYGMFTQLGDPEPMIRLLKKAKKHLEKVEKRSRRNPLLKVWRGK